jgi:CHAT domain-containing protein
MVLAASSGPALAAPMATCSTTTSVSAREAAFVTGPLQTQGTQPSETRIPVLAAHPYLIEVAETGNDALLEVLDSRGHLIARADHPERRTGTRRALIPAAVDQPLTIRVTGKEQTTLVGTATIRVIDLSYLGDRTACLDALRTLARADSEYAAGEEIARGRSTSQAGNARLDFLQAAEDYSSAQLALSATGDIALRGQVTLALASAEYLELQDWAKAAEAAREAAALLGNEDPYRRARAQALIAAASMEIALQASSGQSLPGVGADATRLLDHARQSLRALSRFHLQRHEPYGAGLQLTNVGLTYLYEGRYWECAAASRVSSDLFGSLHEIQRRAQAWQNRALCLWGLGRLSEALHLFDRALKDIGPEPYPKMYLSAINNAALLNYALGNFDAALRLFDRTLGLAVKVQAQRNEAQTLYGLGVTYYAIGDRDRAQQFLERALAIRTAALDGQGRMATLRALATIQAEEGRVEEAVATDREALGLAANPWSAARIKLQLAAFAATRGRRDDARAILDELLAQGPTADPVIRAEALLRSAALHREAGEFTQALDELAFAQPQLHRCGNIAEEFAVQLERARTLRAQGHTAEALVAVDRALSRAQAIRLQTANPELRAQLQAPLRPADDLKLDLLWSQFDQARKTGQSADAARLAERAFQSADASRARTFADLARATYAADMRRDLAPEFARRDVLYREIAARQFTLDLREDRSGSSDARAQGLIHDITNLRRELDGLNTRIAERAGSAGPRGQPLGLPAVPADTALVAYWLGAESAYAWVVTATGIHWSRLESPRVIAENVRAFHQSLTRFVDVPKERRLQYAASLYEQLITPIEPWVAGSRHWLVIPDGSLNYVPFAALWRHQPVGGSFVVASHDIALAPAAWMLESNSSRPPRHHARDLLLVSDPVYEASDPRLAALGKPSQPVLTPIPGIHRLAYSGEEAAQISAEFSSVAVDQLTGLSATRERLLALDLSQYRFIHIATHGRVDAQIPQLSALLLGRFDADGHEVDGAVRVADLSMRTLTAEVVVLSACDTALGKESLSEGLMGMGYTTLSRGARAVVASLWSAADEMSAQLMTEFYQHLLRDSMSPTAALSAALRSVVVRDPFADPALWAPFQVSVVSFDAGYKARAEVTAQTH